CGAVHGGISRKRNVSSSDYWLSMPAARRLTASMVRNVVRCTARARPITSGTLPPIGDGLQFGGMSGAEDVPGRKARQGVEPKECALRRHWPAVADDARIGQGLFDDE